MSASKTVSVTSIHQSNERRRLAQVPAPLAIGSVLLEDGSTVKGFMAEPYVVEAGAGVTDITHLASWLSYLDRGAVP